MKRWVDLYTLGDCTAQKEGAQVAAVWYPQHMSEEGTIPTKRLLARDYTIVVSFHALLLFWSVTLLVHFMPVEQRGFLITSLAMSGLLPAIGAYRYATLRRLLETGLDGTGEVRELLRQGSRWRVLFSYSLDGRDYREVHAFVSLKERLPPEHFVNKICEKNKFPKKNFTESGLNALKQMSWTGNVRELRNLIERIVIMVQKDEITDQDIYGLIPHSSKDFEELIDFSNNFQEFKEKSEKAYIIKQLENNNWNVSKTAEVMEIQRSHLYGKMKKYNIEKGKD